MLGARAWTCEGVKHRAAFHNLLKVVYEFLESCEGCRKSNRAVVKAGDTISPMHRPLPWSVGLGSVLRVGPAFTVHEPLTICNCRSLRSPDVIHCSPDLIRIQCVMQLEASNILIKHYDFVVPLNFGRVQILKKTVVRTLD
jgi:hypothetical protein